MNAACGCDAPALAHGQCSRCYKRDYARKRRSTPPTQTAAVPSTAPCSYEAAHVRVRHWRGVASQHSCVECGFTAQQWAYVGSSSWEQRDGHRVWSPYVNDYQPMCVPCHRIKDATIRRDSREVPA